MHFYCHTTGHWPSFVSLNCLLWCFFRNLCDCRTAFVHFLQQAVALQWLREPCLLLGNKKNECGLFHNQIDFFLKERFLVVCNKKNSLDEDSYWHLSNEERIFKNLYIFWYRYFACLIDRYVHTAVICYWICDCHYFIFLWCDIRVQGSQCGRQ